MNKTQKGITLIALVITVIVLLILAGTAISIAVNGGDLFGKAENSVNRYNAKVADENTAVDEVLDILEQASQLANAQEPGLYDQDGNIIYTWEELITPSNNLLSFNSNTGSLQRSAFNVSQTNTKLVVSPEVTSISSMGGITQISELVLPDTITSFSFAGFYGLTKVNRN